MDQVSLPEGFHIEKGSREDIPLVLSLIKELAQYEKLSDEVVATEKNLERYLFGEDQTAEVVIGYLDKQAVGFALFFHNFSTFLGRHGLYLEDLYVRPEWRGNGFGKALLTYLARLANNRGCGRMEWAVLNWNKPAIKFYKSLNARPMDEWTIYRLSGEALKAFDQ